MNTNISLAALSLRLSAGAMMLVHGWPKFLKVIQGEWGFANPIGIGEVPTLLIAVVAEFICPILLIIGYKTKWAAIPPAITMIVAAFIVNADSTWSRQELPTLYLFCYIAIFFLGSGKYSFDAKFNS